MVSPADGWEDTDAGYESESTRIEVSEIEGEIIDGGELNRYSGFEVRVWQGKPGYASPKEIATYEEAKPAWELANLLTHYLTQRPDRSGLSDLRGGQHGERLPPEGLADREPERLLRDALGYNEFHLDNALDG